MNTINKTEREKIFHILVSRGFPELIAESIAVQTNLPLIWRGWKKYKLIEIVYSFLAWDDSEEAYDFWHALVMSMENSQQ